MYDLALSAAYCPGCFLILEEFSPKMRYEWLGAFSGKRSHDIKINYLVVMFVELKRTDINMQMCVLYGMFMERKPVIKF
jgi:hypothetical protein